MKPTAILLCAGKGTRMNDDRTHKVCYEVAGVPVILRQISNLREAGITRFVIVVGFRAEKVMETLDGVEGVVYAYQATQNGTGGAALCGLRALRAIDPKCPALIAMGDKIISPDVIKELCEKYESGEFGSVFAVAPKEFNESGGRIARRGDKVCGIYEFADSGMLALGEMKGQDEEAMRERLTSLGISGKKIPKLIARALELGDSLSPTVTLRGETFTHDDIESGEYVNTATYIADSEALFAELETTGEDNAQGEIYLTDAINALTEKRGAGICVISDPAKMLTYSTMDELLLLGKYFTAPASKRGLPLASEWMVRLEGSDIDLLNSFKDIYGDNPELIESRRQMYISLVKAFLERYGDREIVVTRSPGRVNLLGRHIEHRGGSINVMSIDRETLAAVAPRDDDIVTLANTDREHFSEYSFSILDTIRACETDDWVDFIESEAISQMVVNSRGEWVNYVKAGVLRLQLENRKSLLCGMDMMFTGDIPIAAGLSSSSSIVVASNEAAAALNDISLQPREFINLCGEGEWFVGSRGGAGDHAAMKCGKRDMITHLSFCPFEICDSVPFPSEYKVVVANSCIEAKKSAGAKDHFNQKVACYEFGFMLVKKLFPQYSGKLNYLKDINPRTLGVAPSEIYKILLSLPEYMTSDEIHASMPENEERIKRIQRNHAIPDRYEIRSTMLYGVAECERAKKCIELLKAGNYEGLGRLMNISHNGDRVWKSGKKYDYSAPDAYLYGLVNDLMSQEPERVSSAQLYEQPGGYGCSTEVIDELVDYINTRPGVLGSELSGAGLGGCIIILVKTENTEELLASLKEHYYDKNSLPMGAQVFIPVAGSGVVM